MNLLFSSLNSKELIINHNAGFFSCCSIILNEIILHQRKRFHSGQVQCLAFGDRVNKASQAFTRITTSSAGLTRMAKSFHEPTTTINTSISPRETIKFSRIL